jgi:hypothetical protein
VLTRDLARCAALERESMAIIAKLTAYAAGGGLHSAEAILVPKEITYLFIDGGCLKHRPIVG